MSDNNYHMIVIGGGAAGLTASAFAGTLGVKVALIERKALGGDCTWAGCVPSKALLKVSKIAHAVREAEHYGITTTGPQIDMMAVRAYVKKSIQEVYQHETPEVFSKRGVDVIEGEARFIDSYTIDVEGRRLTAKKFIIATGARAAVPSIPGLDSVPYMTNHTIFDNDRVPDHLIVMGGGPIGVEMAQAYRRLGAEVTVLDVALLPRDEPEAGEVIGRVFAGEGIRFINSLVESVAKDGEQIIVRLQNGDEIGGDMLLVATGRAPNVDTLGLERVGVTFSRHGIEVDKYLRTNIPHIYAVGDCTTGPKFTHYAGIQAAAAARNALLPIVNTGGHDEDNLPWVTFTDPEVAHVGLTEAQARERHGDEVKVFNFDMANGDRTILERDTVGFIKLVYKGSGNLLGATIIAERAGEMITEFTLVLKTGISLRSLISAMHAYPTYSDIVRKAVSQLLVKELFAGTSGKVIDAAGKILW